jgi:tetratricopeptide (TPR) repeat protein
VYEGTSRSEPARSGRTAPAQLPADVSAFTGRVAELAELDRLADLTRPADPHRPAEPSRPGAGRDATAVVIAAVAGTAGVGKTALAVRWAHRVRRRFPDGQLYVDLRGYDPGRPVPAAEALASFLAALGVPGPDIPVDQAGRAARFRTEVSGRSLLIMLDNAGSVEQVRPLLPGSPGCVVLVTSRDSLAGLVARDGARRLDLDLLPDHDALDLLRRLIGARVDAEPAAAARLVEQCARLPLALRVAAELATSRPGVPLAELVDELTDQRRRLDLLEAGGDVRAVFSWSYRHLPPAAATLFRLLGLHPGAEFEPYAVASLGDTERDGAVRLLDTLTRAHLVETTGAGRYRMHDLLRGYARQLAETADPAPVRDAAWTRLLDHYLATTAAASDLLHPIERTRRPQVRLLDAVVPPLPDPPAARAWLEAERAALVAACGHAARHGWPGHATRLSDVLYRYLDTAGRYGDAQAIHTHGLSAARLNGDQAAEARALTGLGLVDWRLGRYRSAADRYQQSLRLFGQVGDPVGEGRALGNLGITYWRLGRYEQAAEYHRRSLALHRRVADRVGEARALNNLGLVEARMGRCPDATEHYQQALRLFHDLTDQIGEGCARNGLGLVYQRLHQYGPAADNHQRALRLLAAAGDRDGAAHALTGLADVDVLAGRCGSALERYQQALRTFQEIGDRLGEATALTGRGDARHGTGRPADAISDHLAALAVAVEIGEQDVQAHAHAGLGLAHHSTGDLDRARMHWHKALALYTDLGVAEAETVRTQLAALDGTPRPKRPPRPGRPGKPVDPSRTNGPRTKTAGAS